MNYTDAENRDLISRASVPETDAEKLALLRRGLATLDARADDPQAREARYWVAWTIDRITERMAGGAGLV